MCSHFVWEECLTPIFASEESYILISKVIGAYLAPHTAGVLTQDIPAESTPSSPTQSTGSQLNVDIIQTAYNHFSPNICYTANVTGLKILHGLILNASKLSLAPL